MIEMSVKNLLKINFKLHTINILYIQVFTSQL